MTEQLSQTDQLFPSHPAHTQNRMEMQPHTERVLHGESYALDLKGKPLMDRDTARAVTGVNGDILATFTLPTNGELPGESAREIAIVDFGEDTSEENPQPVFFHEGNPIPMMGKARRRYGMEAITYTPDSHMSTYAPLQEGKTTLGRGERATGGSDASYKLGISDGSRDVAAISREHLTLNLDGDSLLIEDHSTNGTLLRVPEKSVDYRSIMAIQKGLGADAVKLAREQGVITIYPHPTDKQ
jgi:hypothetical protein